MTPLQGPEVPDRPRGDGPAREPVLAVPLDVRPEVEHVVRTLLREDHLGLVNQALTRVAIQLRPGQIDGVVEDRTVEAGVVLAQRRVAAVEEAEEVVGVRPRDAPAEDVQVEVVDADARDDLAKGRWTGDRVYADLAHRVRDHRTRGSADGIVVRLRRQDLELRLPEDRQGPASRRGVLVARAGRVKLGF